MAEGCIDDDGDASSSSAANIIPKQKSQHRVETASWQRHDLVLITRSIDEMTPRCWSVATVEDTDGTLNSASWLPSIVLLRTGVIVPRKRNQADSIIRVPPEAVSHSREPYREIHDLVRSSLGH